MTKKEYREYEEVVQEFFDREGLANLQHTTNQKGTTL